MRTPRELVEVVRAIAGREAAVVGWIGGAPELARAVLRVGATRASASDWYFDEIQHYVYEGDTLLHVAAAAYDRDVTRALIAAGADVRARNRRGAEPLHYAADGGPDSPTWDPRAQAALVSYLIGAGADPDALDKSGVAPLHRAVRTRCTGAVRALLAGGADPRLRNKHGSTPMDLATSTTGRGGSGSPAAKEEQATIVALLAAAGASARRPRGPNVEGPEK